MLALIFVITNPIVSTTTTRSLSFFELPYSLCLCHGFGVYLAFSYLSDLKDPLLSSLCPYIFLESLVSETQVCISLDDLYF